jgi:hypothetical protein
VAPPRTWLLAGVGCAYALVAATTTPFSKPADVMTAIPIAALAVGVVWQWPARVVPVRLRGDDVPDHPYRLWVVLFAVFIAWELFNYLAHGSRAEHPTLSSMSDAVDRYYPLKALVFFGWLRLGWAIMRRGTPAASNGGASR